MSEKAWRIGVIGLGSIADFHLNSIRDLPNAVIAGVSSRREEVARAAGEEDNCFWTTDYNELLSRSDIDIICLTTSSGSHAEIGKKVLQAGKHLLVEKPLCLLPEDADEMVRIAEEKGVKLGVIFQRRFEDNLQLAKQVVDEGKIGKLLLIEVTTPFYRSQEYYDSADWRGTYAEDGGALMNQGIHQIDLMLWFGGNVKTVYGKTATQTHEMEAEDIGLAVVSFENGALGTIMSSTSLYPGYLPEVKIYGEKGSIQFEGSRIVKWSVPDMPEPDQPDEPAAMGTNNPLSFSYESHKKQIADFIEAVEKGTRPVVTGEDGRASVVLINAIYESSKTGKEISL